MTSNTAGGPTRRERMRAETIAEIKASARRQLQEGGPSGISLRAIAREVGVTPAALYRYFDSLDALLNATCVDLYDELIAATVAAMDAYPKDAHLERMKSWIWAFRAWAVGHRREFELMISFPEGKAAMLIDGEALERDPDPLSRKALEHSQLCGREMAAFYRKTERGEIEAGGPVELPAMSEALKAELMEKCSAFIVGEDMPLPWVFSFTSGWVRVFGLVVMEAFGSLPVRDNVDEFYKTQILTMIKDFGIEG
ncbi:TetR/AcrR family transcriptional regulator [Glycomyces scopariae]|uniref:Transcriptional regulator, TetR family n=1 Tax=Glycomyces sambucus TaxID=380244 RepID=A0A1G9DV12_9ACTN|nr:TetR/AcrR family transcriptional regulator [Glycomyces sambucus]SDK67706.1 transcriptional regulator, TetR family [Glycomyces sambucus]